MVVCLLGVVVRVVTVLVNLLGDEAEQGDIDSAPEEEEDEKEDLASSSKELAEAALGCFFSCLSVCGLVGGWENSDGSTKTPKHRCHTEYSPPAGPTGVFLAVLDLDIMMW